LCEWIFH